MLAVTISEGALLTATRPDPTPGPGEVLVEVHAAGINAADLLQRRGFYPAPPGAPADIPGLELAGVVAGLGDGVTTVALGDRVMAITGGGGQAELATVPASHLLPVPDGMSWAEAGGFAETFSTAYDALVSQAGLVAGDRVVISGGAGGVGTSAVQLAHALGAHVVATVRNPAHHDSVRALGADVVIEPDQIGDHGPYDISLELVGAPGVESVLAHLAPHARIVVIGVGGGAKAEVNLLAIMGARATLGGSTLRARSIEEKASVASGVIQDVLPLLASGVLRVEVAETFPLTEAHAAYERFQAGGKFGKIVLLRP